MIHKEDAKGGPESFSVVGKITGPHVKVGKRERVLVYSFLTDVFVAQIWRSLQEHSILIQNNLGCTCQGGVKSCGFY